MNLSVGQLIKKKLIKIEIAEMRMLRWMCSVTKMDKTKNEYLRGSLDVTNIAKYTRETF